MPSAISDISISGQSELFQPVGKKELDRNDFMKLFITQLQFQDPMKPMDSYEVSAQLAQFSSLEATMNMSESMDRLLDYQMSQNNLQLLNLLNTEVETSGNFMAVAGGNARATAFILDQPVESCRVSVFDAAGHLMDSMDLGPMETGRHDFVWDGKDRLGNTVDDGMYSYEVEGISPLGDKAGVEYISTGMVTGLSFDQGQATLTLDDYLSVDVSDIRTVNSETQPTADVAVDTALDALGSN